MKPHPDLSLLEDAALEAGRLAMTWFGENPKAWSKEGGSPVTEADMAVDLLLRERLLRERPAYGWLSEETADDAARLGMPRVFVVDPIDGTRGFMTGDKRWCVSIALVEDGRPVAAALYAPAIERLYLAAAGAGAVCNGAPIRVSGRRELLDAHVAGPKSWFGSQAMRRLPTRRADYVPSLALRFALVADGSYDAAFASARSHDWDLAGCDLLVHEAGGRLTGLGGATPRYNRADLRHETLAAGGASIQAELIRVVAGAAEERRAAGLAV